MRDAMKSIIPGKLYLAAWSLALTVSATAAWADNHEEEKILLEKVTCGGSASLGDMFCSFQNSTVTQLVTLIFGAAFIGGIYLFWRGLQLLIRATDTNGQQTKLASALLPLASGAFLIALPATIAIGLGTLYDDNGVWDFETQDKGATGTLESGDLLSMIGNFAINAAGPLSTLVMGIAVVIGIVLIASSMFGMAKLADPSGQGDTFKAVATKFFVGVCLVNVFWIMDAIGASFGLKSMDSSSLTNITKNALSYATAVTETDNVTDRFNNVIQVAFMALIPFGLIAFVRGMLILKDSASGAQQASIGAGFTHIIGGIALVNAKVVSCAIMKTLAGGASFCAGA